MRKIGKKEPLVQISVRLPHALHQKVIGLATHERRSMNDQILYMLEMASRSRLALLEAILQWELVQETETESQQPAKPRNLLEALQQAKTQLSKK